MCFSNFKLDWFEDRGWNRLGNRSRDCLALVPGQLDRSAALDPVQVWSCGIVGPGCGTGDGGWGSGKGLGTGAGISG